ncbi:MAG: helix-turn-helix domain-containing protein [Myxococcaceae bacterium]
MRRTRLDQWPCSIARTVDLIGDGWTPMILREAYYGVKRFDDFEANLGLGRNVLTQRLKRLVKEGVFEKVRYQKHPPRHEYVLTEKGRSLFPVLAVMMRWGDRWLSKGEGAPVELLDRESGELLDAMVVDSGTREPIALGKVRTRLGPGFPKKLESWAMSTGRYVPRKG